MDVRYLSIAQDKNIKSSGESQVGLWGDGVGCPHSAGGLHQGREASPRFGWEKRDPSIRRGGDRGERRRGRVGGEETWSEKIQKKITKMDFGEMAGNKKFYLEKNPKNTQK